MSTPMFLVGGYLSGDQVHLAYGTYGDCEIRAGC